MMSAHIVGRGPQKIGMMYTWCAHGVPMAPAWCVHDAFYYSCCFFEKIIMYSHDAYMMYVNAHDAHMLTWCVWVTEY